MPETAEKLISMAGEVPAVHLDECRRLFRARAVSAGLPDEQPSNRVLLAWCFNVVSRLDEDKLDEILRGQS